MIHLLRCNRVRRTGDANTENTTAPTAPPANNQQNAAVNLRPPGAGNNTVRPIRWMRGNRGAR